MASAGDTYYNPVTRTRVTFLAVPDASGQGELVTEWEVPPGETLPSTPHYHYRAGAGQNATAEQFEVLAGTATYGVGGQERQAAAGTVIDIPVNTVHVHPHNAGAEMLRVRQKAASRGPDVLSRVERYFETLIALSQKGLVDRQGKILDPLQSAITGNAFLIDPTFLPGPPRVAQKLLFGALARLASWRGLKAYHQPEHGLDEETSA